VSQHTNLTRDGNRAGQVGFGSDGSGQFDLLEEIGSGSGRINLHVVFFQIVDRFRLD
jgi:hypothetical protein